MRAFNLRLGLSASLFAQAQFAVPLTGTGYAGPYDAHTTPDGGQVLCGLFSESLDLDPSGAVFTVTSLGDADAWVAKYDAVGAFVWGFAIGGTGSDAARGITVDENGDVHVVGSFEGTIDLDPGSGTSSVSSAGDRDIFWVKLDANGQHLWSGRIGGTERQFPTDIDRDLAGHIYLCGWTMGTGDFDPGTATLNVTTTNTGTIYETNISFLAKFDLVGIPAWANSLGGLTPYIAVEPGGSAIYFTSASEATAATDEDFDPTGGTLPPVTSTEPDDDYMALVKYDASGNVVWSVFESGYADFDQNDNKGNALAIDGNGDVYWAGEFINDMTQYPGNDLTLDAPGTGRDGFLVKYSSSGSLLWEKRFGAANEGDYCSAIAVGAQDNVWVAGGIAGTAELNSAGSSVQVTSAGGYDIHLVAFASNGNYLWHGMVGGPGTDGTPNITVGASSIRLSGFFSATADLDPTAATSMHTAVGTNDAFISAFVPAMALGSGSDEVVTDQVVLCPNPANDRITIRVTPSNSPVEVFDALGQRMISTRTDAIDVSAWSEGIYFVKAEGRTERIVIQH